MFETDANLWLQAFDAPWLLWCMVAVSELGTTAAYTAAILLLAFGARFRPTLGVLLGLVITGAVTGLFKLGFALPRPSEVDARVLNKGEAGHALVEDGAADTFWGLPGDQAIDAVRAAGEMDYGFISGHSSAAMAFMLGIALFFGFRRRWAWALAIGWALLVGLSRMYLGRHFLADVLGGWIAGALAAWLAWRFVRAIESGDAGRHAWAWTVALASVGAILLSSIRWPFVLPGSAGELAGVLVCLFVASRVGAFDESGVVRRLLRTALALVLGFGIDALTRWAWDAGDWPDTHPLAFVFPAVGYPLAILGTFFVARGLRLYRPLPA